MMNIYNYDPNTGEFVSSTHAIPNPLELNAFLTPANATTIAPPTTTQYQKAIFINNNWTIVPDWRGIPLYSTIDGSPIIIRVLNVTPESINATILVPPAGVNLSPVWVNGAWTLEPDYRNAKLYSTKTSLPISATAIGQTLDSINATMIVPPTGVNQSPVWVNGAWTLEPDYRGAQLYSKITGNPISATAIGQTLDSISATTLVPPTGVNQSPVWVNGAWTLEPDYRGAQLYSTLTGNPISATAIGQTLTSLNATLVVPPTGVNQSPVWVNGAWTLEPDYHNAKLYSIVNGSSIDSINVTIGQTLTSLNATTIAPPDNTMVWSFNGTAWVINYPAFTEMLLAYGEMTQYKVLAAGINVNIASSGNPPITILCDGNAATIAMLNFLVVWGTANPTGTDVWKDNNRVFTTLTGTEFVNLAWAIGAWIKNVYAFEANLETQIKAGAVITTKQIDELVWPSA